MIIINWYFYLINKHNCTGACVYEIETMDSIIVYLELVEIRKNALVRFRGKHDSKGNPLVLHALSETKNNIHRFSKRSLFGLDEQPLNIHSSN